jgi:electron transport protein HydN
MEVVTRPIERDVSGVKLADGVKAEAHKCDLCVTRPQGPACVEVCPTAALHVMDEAMMAELQTQRRLRTALGSSFTAL